MIFNVTKLNKVLLLQTLYIHADPKGYGKIVYNHQDAKGKNVLGLTDEECKDILSKEVAEFSGFLVDYLNGKPIKLDFDIQPNGDVWTTSISYDISNGRYRFLEALLYVFDLDEIVMITKEYPPGIDDLLDTNTTREDYETQILKNILEQPIEHSDNGIYWKFNSDTVDYTPPSMRGI